VFFRVFQFLAMIIQTLWLKFCEATLVYFHLSDTFGIQGSLSKLKNRDWRHFPQVYFRLKPKSIVGNHFSFCEKAICERILAPWSSLQSLEFSSIFERNEWAIQNDQRNNSKFKLNSDSGISLYFQRHLFTFEWAHSSKTIVAKWISRQKI